MTRLKSLGFEDGIREFDSVTTSAYCTTDISTVRTGVRSAYFNNSSTQNGGPASLTFPATSEIYIGFGFYLASGSGTSSKSIFRLRSGTTNLFQLYLEQGNAMSGYVSTVKQIDNFPYAANQWHYVSIYAKADSVNGEFEIRLNGESVGTYSGNTGALGMDNFYILNTGTTSAFFSFCIDDLVINDAGGYYNNSWPGQTKLIPVPVSADGDVTELSRGGIDSGANWSQVSTIPAVDTSYVYGTEADLRDLYTLDLTGIELPEGLTIENVIVFLRSAIDSGAGGISATLKIDTTEVESELVGTLSGTFADRTFAFPVDPVLDTPWSITRIPIVQIGPKNKDI
jgi:hypothetical protein